MDIDNATRMAPAVQTGAQGPSRSVVAHAVDMLRRDPVLVVTLGYVSISFIGVWGSWWFYRGFDVRILDYL